MVVARVVVRKGRVVQAAGRAANRPAVAPVAVAMAVQRADQKVAASQTRCRPLSVLAMPVRHAVRRVRKVRAAPIMACRAAAAAVNRLAAGVV
jgi:hypothetical protein